MHSTWFNPLRRTSSSRCSIPIAEIKIVFATVPESLFNKLYVVVAIEEDVHKVEALSVRISFELRDIRICVVLVEFQLH